MKPPPPAYKPVSDALLEFQKARVAFVNTVNELLGKGDPGMDAALLDGNLLPILYEPLVQGASGVHLPSPHAPPRVRAGQRND